MCIDQHIQAFGERHLGLYSLQRSPVAHIGHAVLNLWVRLTGFCG
jgi:hypothetical protein